MLKHIVAVTIASVFILAGNVFSTSALINYNGSAEGVKTGSHTIEFTIYRTQTGDTPIWQETHSGVQVTDGKFKVMLGGISPIPDSVWNGAIWLETRIDGKVLSERKPIVRFSESDKKLSSYGPKTEGSLAWVEGTQLVVSPPVETNELADGAVTEAKLGNDAVTSVKIKDGTIQQTDLAFTLPGIRTYEVYRENMEECSSSTWVDMPNMTITGVETTADEIVLVLFSTGGLDATSLGGTHVACRILRDGTEIAKTYVGVMESGVEGMAIPVSLQRIDSPSAGDHTYKVQWKVSTDRAVQTLGHRCLTLLVIRQ